MCLNKISKKNVRPTDQSQMLQVIVQNMTEREKNTIHNSYFSEQ